MSAGEITFVTSKRSPLLKTGRHNSREKATGSREPVSGFTKHSKVRFSRNTWVLHIHVYHVKMLNTTVRKNDTSTFHLQVGDDFLARYSLR